MLENSFGFFRSQIDDVVVAIPVGDVDLLSAPKLYSGLLAGLSDSPPVMIVRLDLVTFLGSAGICALMRAYRQACELHVFYALVGPSPRSQKVLALTGVDRQIPSYPTLRSALAAARGDRNGSMSTLHTG